MTHAGLYARLSELRDRDRETSVDRQLADMLAYCERHGLEVARTYREEGVSAYHKPGRARAPERPEFERLLADLDAGELDAVVCWRLDRLARGHGDFQRLWEACERAGARLISLHEGFDTSTPAGELVVRKLVSMAKWESDSISLRVRRAVEAAVRDGRPHGGGRRPLGYDRAGNLVPAEAEALRYAADQVLAGRSLRSIVLELRTRGVTGAGGGSLTGRTLRQVLIGPRAAGLRTHRGEEMPGTWPPILSRAQHEQLRALLRPGQRKGRPPAHLLTGLLRCGRDGCGHRMYYSVESRQPDRYACRGGVTPGVEHLSIAARQLEELLTEAVLIRLDHHGLGAALASQRQAPSQAVASQLAADEAALVQLATDHYTSRLIGRAEFLAARGVLEDRIRQARDALARSARQAALAGLPTAPGALRAAWEDLDLAQRRAVLGVALEQVIIRPATRRGRYFDRDRVEPIWRAGLNVD